MAKKKSVAAESPALKPVFIGTAGWSVRKDAPEEFAGEGSHLTRYSRGLNCVEVNSTFYRPHRAATWARWAQTVPDDFRFALKAPKAITHTARLQRAGAHLVEFLDQVSGLGDKLGPILFQLPPKLAFDPGVAEDFLATVRELTQGLVAFEPRHASWFEGEANDLLRRHHIARVAADPARVPAAGRPGGWLDWRYFRLHGSPRTYWSRYPPEYVAALAAEISRPRSPLSGPAWCIFDNTAEGAAIWNAQQMRDALREKG